MSMKSISLAVALFTLGWPTPMALAAPPSPAQAQEAASAIPNLRDLGGYVTADGHKVRSGLLFRSDQLYHLTPADKAELARLGLKTVYDLRTQGERSAYPDELPAGATGEVWDVRSNEKSNPLAVQFDQLMADPKAAEAMFGNGKGAALMLKRYRDYVSSPPALAAYQGLFLSLSNSANLPSLFHCTAGKDRTGWATAALLSLLGVDEATILHDYLASNQITLAKHRQALEEYQARGGDPDLWKPVLGVKMEYLLTAFDEMHKKYGDIQGYFEKGLGIDRAGQKRLREIYLEP